MAADVAREGELLEELLHPLGILALVGIDLGVRSLKVAGGQDTRSAMTGAGHEDDVQVVALDHAVQVRPDERKRRARAPVAEQPMLDVLHAERLAQQRIVSQVDHADGQVVASTPPRMHAVELLRIEWPRSDGVGGRLPRDTTFRRHAAPPESIEILTPRASAPCAPQILDQTIVGTSKYS